MQNLNYFKTLSIFTVFAFAILAPISAIADKKLKAVTTFTIIADMARNVAGDKADVVSITKPGAEIHNYQPTPRDLVKAQGSNLVLWNGLNLELWFEKFFVNLEDVPSAVLTDGIEPIGIGNGPYLGKPNPHAWMSPKNAIIYVDNVAKAFAEHDPSNAASYFENATIYKAQINAAIEPMRKVLEAIPAEKRYLVTSEGAFSYLARDFNLTEVYIWPVNADQVGTPKQMRNVIDTVRAKNAPAIFSESTVSDAAAKQVARETGSKYGGILYVDSLSDENGPVPTYLDLLRVTTKTIADALGEQNDG